VLGLAIIVARLIDQPAVSNTATAARSAHPKD